MVVRVLASSAVPIVTEQVRIHAVGIAEEGPNRLNLFCCEISVAVDPPIVFTLGNEGVDHEFKDVRKTPRQRIRLRVGGLGLRFPLHVLGRVCTFHACQYGTK